jgi:hypothetical protein
MSDQQPLAAVPERGGPARAVAPEALPVRGGLTSGGSGGPARARRACRALDPEALPVQWLRRPGPCEAGLTRRRRAIGGGTRGRGRCSAWAEPTPSIALAATGGGLDTLDTDLPEKTQSARAGMHVLVLVLQLSEQQS